MKHERDNSVLRVKGLWLEPGQRLPAARQERLEAELERQRRFTGAERITFARGWLKEKSSPCLGFQRVRAKTARPARMPPNELPMPRKERPEAVTRKVPPAASRSPKPETPRGR